MHARAAVENFKKKMFATISKKQIMLRLGKLSGFSEWFSPSSYSWISIHE
jgi:hypothetical protein